MAKCPEDCRYRSREAEFCGFCMKKILRERQGNCEDNRPEEAADSEISGIPGDGHGQEDPETDD